MSKGGAACGHEFVRSIENVRGAGVSRRERTSMFGDAGSDLGSWLFKLQIYLGTVAPVLWSSARHRQTLRPFVRVLTGVVAVIPVVGAALWFLELSPARDTRG